ncbi:c-type cytochrome biogenesis protein CcmI [Paraglaciecola hydrolytica]|uniref:Uncharacterized protein n=1 Tax=Paraglaciecola hydrolytica TaxID=1799789 RepID=A0A135ZYS6_9ALTE|nr:c-type cytochrome biogenesis protein CcmI [Paraglaciecola hydrolytica]KXI28138.1 hypothetical protein AX660_17285 [Paraglaciecola hydrolytica]
MVYLGGASVLVILALLLISLPWLHRSKKNQQDVLTNTRLVKLRLSELAVEQEQGLLSASDRQQAENELKLALLDEVQDNVPAQQATVWILLLGLLLAVAVAGTVYFKTNSLSQLHAWDDAITRLPELGKSINNKEDINTQDLQDFALGLRTRLHQEPDNAVGWMLLGRVWGALNQPQTAKDAFEKSIQLNPDSVGALLSYAQALILIGSESEIRQAKRALQQVLKFEPDNTNALATLAVVSTELGDNVSAQGYWQRIQAGLPVSDPNYSMVQQKIDELKNINGGDLSASTETTNVLSNKIRITINVQLDTALRQQLPENGVVFVFAQDASGQVRMPAAVVKLPLGQFPFTVELSDDNAMMANYTLSSLSKVKLVARISRDENVAQAQGELQGEVLVDLQVDDLSQQTILINKEIM